MCLFCSFLTSVTSEAAEETVKWNKALGINLNIRCFYFLHHDTDMCCTCCIPADPEATHSAAGCYFGTLTKRASLWGFQYGQLWEAGAAGVTSHPGCAPRAVLLHTGYLPAAVSTLLWNTDKCIVEDITVYYIQAAFCFKFLQHWWMVHLH